MKNYLIILSLFFTTCAFAYQVTYVEKYPMYGYCPICRVPYNNQVIYRPIYNPYSNYNNLYRNNYNTPYNFRRIKGLQKRRFNTIGFLNNKNGSLTGYSVPINKNDIFNQNFNSNNSKIMPKLNSTNCNQELFSAPSGNEEYYSNGERYKDLYGISGKTGVTIIYD